MSRSISPVIEATYLYVRPLAKGETVARTVSLSDSLNVDLDADGRVLGIETLDGPITPADYYSIVLAIGDVL